MNPLPALLAALQAAPVVTPDPDRAAVNAAIGAFAFGCLERARFANSANDYASGTDKIAALVKSTPETAALRFRIAGVGGDTCRVSYQGTHVDELWKALSDFNKNPMNAPCTDGPTSPARVSISCAANAVNPAYDETIERNGDQLTASIRWRGRDLP